MIKIKPPPYNAEKYIKKDVAASFWKDSNDLLWRVNIFRRYISHDSLSTKSKIYVDLIMAIKCSLKSLIISLSKNDETPESAYLVARNCSHNLDKLYNEVRKRAKNRIKLLYKDDVDILVKANSLGVGYRYDITTFMFISQETWADRSIRKGKVSSVINHTFINGLIKVAHHLSKIAKNAHSKYLEAYAVQNLKKWKTTENRRSAFLETVK